MFNLRDAVKRMISDLSHPPWYLALKSVRSRTASHEGIICLLILVFIGIEVLVYFGPSVILERLVEF